MGRPLFGGGRPNNIVVAPPQGHVWASGSKLQSPRLDCGGQCFAKVRVPNGIADRSGGLTAGL